MTTSTTRRPASRDLPIYGQHGQPIATVSQTRATYLSSLLAECERGHVYVLPANLAEWLAADAGCPRCRVLGHTPGGNEGNPHAD